MSAELLWSSFYFHKKEKLSVWILTTLHFLQMLIHKEKTGTEFVNQQIIKQKFKAMRPFEIKFDFPVASSNSKISLNATVELHHSEPYFVVHDFFLANNHIDQGRHSILPNQEIKLIKREGSGVWVHKDSEKESELSLAIGEGLESALTKKEIESLFGN